MEKRIMRVFFKVAEFLRDNIRRKDNRDVSRGQHHLPGGGGGGVSGDDGQQTALHSVLLLWRVARVVDGVIATVKQRQDFRIQLQKRARGNTERKLEANEEV